MIDRQPDPIDPGTEGELEALSYQKHGKSCPPKGAKASHTPISFGVVSNLLRLADAMILLSSGYIGFILRFGHSSSITPADHLFIYLATIVMTSSLYLARSYEPPTLLSLNKHLGALFISGLNALFIILFCGYLSGKLHDYSRIWVAVSVLISATLLVANRVIVWIIVQQGVKKRQIVESIAIVGANRQAEKMIAAIRNAPSSGLEILGIFDDRTHERMQGTTKLDVPSSVNSQTVGSTDNLLDYIRRKHICRVVVTLPWITSDRITELLKKLQTVPVRIDLVPNEVIWEFPNINMERLANVPVINIVNGRVDIQQGFIKRLEDLVISFLLLLLMLPLLICIAIAIKIDSKGPVVFKQRRHGYNNQIFEVYKFRTMKVDNTSGNEIRQATRYDPRATRVGRCLRRSSLDELPQLFNVLKGEMSIVGPRPHAIQHNMQYCSLISAYFARHNVKPGITGWAQVNGLRGEIDIPEKMRRRVEADIYYIEHWSLLFDVKIIVRSAITVWFQKAAY